MKTAAALLVLLFCSAAPCFAQTRAAARSHARESDEGMAKVHGGTFQMGIDAADVPRLQKFFAIGNGKLFADELPRHRVTVKDFYLDKNLVSNAQFQAFLDANPGFRPGRFPEKFDNGNYLRHWLTPEHASAKPDHPVVNVNWYAASAYCGWAGKRLPAEAEWEFAARGGRDTLFPWGDQPPDSSRANFDNHLGTTTPVGSYPANPYGLFDMAGNVWQFLADRWEPYPSARLETRAKRNPRTWRQILRDPSPDTARRTIRGGSYAGHPVNLWVGYRDSHPPTGSEPFVGFRCARSAAGAL